MNTKKDLELLPAIKEQQKCEFQYDMMTFLSEKPRQYKTLNKWSNQNIYQNTIILEKLIMQALKFQD